VRQAGYQEAIEDLLQFLDRENLGLGDGEGWSVRRWATERLDGSGVAASDDDDTDKRARSTTPTAVRKDSLVQEPSQQPAKPTSLPNEVSAAPQQQQQQPTQSHEANTSDRPALFTFTSGPSFPQPQEQDVD